MDSHWNRPDAHYGAAEYRRTALGREKADPQQKPQSCIKRLIKRKKKTEDRPSETIPEPVFLLSEKGNRRVGRGGRRGRKKKKAEKKQAKRKELWCVHQSSLMPEMIQFGFSAIFRNPYTGFFSIAAFSIQLYLGSLRFCRKPFEYWNLVHGRLPISHFATWFSSRTSFWPAGHKAWTFIAFGNPLQWCPSYRGWLFKKPLK